MATKDIEYNKNYWDAFYKSNHRHTPSQFCVCVLTEVNTDVVIVELGSGNGRDSHYFASQGYITIAMDMSEQAITSCESLAKSRNIEHSAFIQGDITSRASIKKIIDYARNEAEGKDLVFYSRFVMHSIDSEQELAFLELLSVFMKHGESIYFEFRSKEDSELKKVHGIEHFRRYIDTEHFKKLLVEKFGFNVTYSITGKGMAKFKEEDPFVSRIIASKQ